MKNDTRQFPRLPEFSVSWAPVCLEPIIASGERVTVAIAAIPTQGKEGQPVVYPILDDARAQCLLGRGAAAFQAIVYLCVWDLRRYLELHTDLGGWVAPVDGASIGEVRLLYATDMASAIRVTAHKSAFMSSSEIVVDTEYLV